MLCANIGDFRHAVARRRVFWQPIMSDNESESLLDRIYEAAIVPTQWPLILKEFTERLEGVGGVVFTINPTKSDWVASQGFTEGFGNFAQAGFAGDNLRIRKAFERGMIGFTAGDHEFITPDEMDRDPMYAFLRQNGSGWCVGSMIAAPHGDMLVFSFERAFAKGHFNAEEVAYVERFRPHFARAALLSARLGFDRVRAASEALELIGLAAAVVSRSKRLMNANALFQQLIPAQVQDAAPRMRLADAKADGVLNFALDRVMMQPETRDIFSLPVPAVEGAPAFALHVIPVRRAANDIFAEASCFLVATPVQRREAPPVSLLQGLFDLTAAEARLARALASGQTLTEAATQFGLQTASLRTQLKGVFAKTGLSRQSDLVGLLGSISLHKPK